MSKQHNDNKSRCEIQNNKVKFYKIKNKQTNKVILVNFLPFLKSSVAAKNGKAKSQFGKKWNVICG